MAGTCTLMTGKRTRRRVRDCLAQALGSMWQHLACQAWAWAALRTLKDMSPSSRPRSVFNDAGSPTCGSACSALPPPRSSATAWPP